MTAKHTPGPWINYGADTFGKANVITIKSAQPEGVSCIAFLWTDGGEDIEAAQNANARLITAAPVMKAALEMVLDADGDVDAIDFQMIRNALVEAGVDL